MRPMKKPRVIVQTASDHRIYVEQNGERILYAVTDKLKEAKALVVSFQEVVHLV